MFVLSVALSSDRHSDDRFKAAIYPKASERWLWWTAASSRRQVAKIRPDQRVGGKFRWTRGCCSPTCESTRPTDRSLGPLTASPLLSPGEIERDHITVCVGNFITNDYSLRFILFWKVLSPIISCTLFHVCAASTCKSHGQCLILLSSDCDRMRRYTFIW